MLYILFFLAGNFTLEAEPGTWFDYARSGYLTKSRYILVQHGGEKGTYDKGTKTSILDPEGKVIYTIPQDIGAWSLIPGVLGDPDFYLFPSRQEIDALKLWHPRYGVKNIERPGSYQIKSFALSEDGNKVFIFGAITKMKENGRMDLKNHVEILEFNEKTAAALFSKDFFFEYKRIDFRQPMEFYVNKQGFYIYSFFPEKYWFKMPFTGLPSEKPFEFIRSDFQIKTLAYHWGYLLITTFLDGDDRTVLFQKEAGPPIWRLGGDRFETTDPAVLKLREFISAFDAGWVTEKNGVLSYITKDGVLTDLDVGAMEIRRYQLGPGDHERTLNSKETIFCDGKIFRVTEVEQVDLRTPSRFIEGLPIPAECRWRIQ